MSSMTLVAMDVTVSRALPGPVGTAAELGDGRLGRDGSAGPGRSVRCVTRRTMVARRVGVLDGQCDRRAQQGQTGRGQEGGVVRRQVGTERPSTTWVVPDGGQHGGQDGDPERARPVAGRC